MKPELNPELSLPEAKKPSVAKPMARWSAFACGLAVVVIMLGAWTRLVDAGLGCPDWPGCYGFLTVPQSETSIAIANARFPETPVDVSKGWPEMIHRYAAGTLGLVVFGLAIAAIRRALDVGASVSGSTDDVDQSKFEHPPAKCKKGGAR